MKTLKIGIIIFILNILSLNSIIPQKITRLVSSTASDRWVENLKVKPSGKPSETLTIDIYTDSILQKVDGFGATFNEIGWDALQFLPAEKQKDVMESLFGPKGTNFTIGRTPIGASDFAFGYYLYNIIEK